jgi:hypothetical protein
MGWLGLSAGKQKRAPAGSANGGVGHDRLARGRWWAYGGGKAPVLLMLAMLLKTRGGSASEARRAALAFDRGQADDEAVEVVAHHDLAAESRVGLAVLNEFEQVLLFELRVVEALAPLLVDVDVAGAA